MRKARSSALMAVAAGQANTSCTHARCAAHDVVSAGPLAPQFMHAHRITRRRPADRAAGSHPGWVVCPPAAAAGCKPMPHPAAHSSVAGPAVVMLPAR
ncbi:hypothetical protein [Paractinoplanes brasiliensis]|uniref:Uncharacterized protein n=1 Tax=Paractinoplanes brasiliensis TaxID=52695 RepID=A0A4R6JUS3_9ACTN|nr:hypothetical protein [Actinoplanes brasiliensis]TDO38405.1 hypothetical protein C8E87_2058 [Actinoplanes brasiliensis]